MKSVVNHIIRSDPETSGIAKFIGDFPGNLIHIQVREPLETQNICITTNIGRILLIILCVMAVSHHVLQFSTIETSDGLDWLLCLSI
jgi:hypothetical protein